MSHPRILLNLKNVGFSIKKNLYPGSQCGPRSLLEFKEPTFGDVDFPNIILENFHDYGKISLFSNKFFKKAKVGSHKYEKK
jgi:hypothetical protein